MAVIYSIGSFSISHFRTTTKKKHFFFQFGQVCCGLWWTANRVRRGVFNHFLCGIGNVRFLSVNILLRCHCRHKSYSLKWTDSCHTKYAGKHSIFQSNNNNVQHENELFSSVRFVCGLRCLELLRRMNNSHSLRHAMTAAMLAEAIDVNHRYSHTEIIAWIIFLSAKIYQFSLRCDSQSRILRIELFGCDSHGKYVSRPIVVTNQSVRVRKRTTACIFQPEHICMCNVTCLT